MIYYITKKRQEKYAASFKLMHALPRLGEAFNLRLNPIWPKHPNVGCEAPQPCDGPCFEYEAVALVLRE